MAGPAAAPDRLTTRNGLAASDLAQVIGQGRAKQVALLIDTCCSGATGARAAASVDEIIARVAKDGFSMFVMSSAHAEDLAWDGVFVEGLLDVLADPDPLLWSKTERFVAPSHVARALRARLGRRGLLMARLQRERGRKYELQARVAGSEPVALASFNLHDDHFSSVFGIELEDGDPASTACVGFGHERIALALLDRHGLRTEEWPADVRRVLWP